jgi:hypothetical protein
MNEMEKAGPATSFEKPRGKSPKENFERRYLSVIEKFFVKS